MPTPTSETSRAPAPFLLSSPRPVLLTQSCFSRTAPFRISTWRRTAQDQVPGRQHVTPATKPDSDPGKNKCKPRINYSPHWGNRGASVTSPAPATRPIQPNATASICLPPAWLRVLLPPSMKTCAQKASLCDHPPSTSQSTYLLAAVTNRLFCSNSKKIIFLEWIALSAISSPSPLPNHPLPSPQTCM